ncbi:diguanylate cyclase domain-containing protein [Rhodoferax sp. PAMC 29310]|uniref:diguanylate cyclase domain-containing protein n=1 Tax=Rhodoferax sp. PAMC 29310 TaxID=2822760 RepID=UPI001F0A81CF|nr:diguanylate cyclase [Rhodoferax sp. PAMC 29310]
MTSVDLASPSNDTDLLEFVEEADLSATQSGLVWRLLIVDDEPDVHRATTLALNGLTLLGRPLEFLHAYTAHEATAILRREQDIAVVLLDVVMEREDSGLALVKVIRQDLRLTDLRIILRTGQPGYAPEIESIDKFDINDYKTKSELTRARLYLTIVAALRTYEQIQALDKLAYYDSLSCLPNRNRFIDLIEERLRKSDGDDGVVAILDLDDFSEVNDTLGHQHGDRLLQVVAQRLTASLGPDTVLARIGSDSFGLMGSAGAINPEELLALLGAPFLGQNNSMRVTAT